MTYVVSKQTYNLLWYVTNEKSRRVAQNQIHDICSTKGVGAFLSDHELNPHKAAAEIMRVAEQELRNLQIVDLTNNVPIDITSFMVDFYADIRKHLMTIMAGWIIAEADNNPGKKYGNGKHFTHVTRTSRNGYAYHFTGGADDTIVTGTKAAIDELTRQWITEDDEDNSAKEPRDD